MFKNPQLVRTRYSARYFAVTALFVASLAIGYSQHSAIMAWAASCTSSADCQRQIDSLNSENTKAQDSLGTLAAQAGSYQAAISALQSQVYALQVQINAAIDQQNSLQNQITGNEQKLKERREYLAADIRALYVDGQLTTIEQLASSKNIGDYVDKEAYRTSVQNKISSVINDITTIQASLKQQKVQVDAIAVSLQAQRSQLAQAQAQQQSLLAYNQSQQDSFNAQISSNKTALSELYAKQAAIIAASFSSSGGLRYGGTGNYPYADAVCLNSNGDCGAYGGSPFGPYAWGYPPSSEYDPIGWAYRNCTGYAFWRLAQTTGVTLNASLFPNVYGSGGRIGQSLPDFRRLGYVVDKDPNGQAVLAVNTAGNFGHIMYVESVVNGQAVVSQYNGAGDGRYSTGTLGNIGSIWFIHIR